MKMMTSAYAVKYLRSLEEDKAYWTNMEAERCTYTAAVDEEPVIPEYDYSQVAKTIAELDNKILVVKHAINLANATARIQVGDMEYSVDSILIKMAQTTRRKTLLDGLRKNQPQTRVDNSYSYAARKGIVEYTYINYDLDLIKSEFERVSDELMALQIALDKYNQTVEFEVDV